MFGPMQVAPILSLQKTGSVEAEVWTLPSLGCWKSAITRKLCAGCSSRLRCSCF
jgi:hypothetical protein